MLKVELSVEKEQLTIRLFDGVERLVPYKTLRGEECNKALKDIISKSMVNTVYDDINHKAQYIYNNQLININNCDHEIMKEVLGNVKAKVPVYKPVVKEPKPKKEKKNIKINQKGIRVMAAGLSIFVLAGSLVAIKKIKKFSLGNLKEETTVVQTVYENPKTETSTSVIVSETTTEPTTEPTTMAETLNSCYSEYSIHIDCKDQTGYEKALNTIKNYGDILTEKANKYGIDPKLVIAIATQENGVHRGYVEEGGGIGIMQIQKSVWSGEAINIYNFEKGCNERIIVNGDDLDELEYNIDIGCAILQDSFKKMNYHFLAGLQCYNLGTGNMDIVLSAYSYNTGKSKSEILSNQYDKGWMEYRDLADGGDKYYIENVFSWIGYDEEILYHIEDEESIKVKINER